MTEDEDAANAALNKIIEACLHEVQRDEHGRLRCVSCQARFAVVMLPRLAPDFHIDPDED